MAPRTNNIHTIDRQTVPTPAPLLFTRLGQFPSLPTELLHLALPPSSPPLLLQLPLLDWNTLNPNLPLHGRDLFQKLCDRSTSDKRPTGRESRAYSHGAAGYCAQPTAVLFLCGRGAGTCELITDTPGKSLNLQAATASRREAISPDDVAALHAALRTHFVTSPSDAAGLPHGRVSALQRRVSRTERQLAAVLTAGARGVLASVQGGDDVAVRGRAAEEAGRIGKDVAGFSIDGLHAGETPEVRWACVEAVVKRLPEAGLRVLGGGHGAPGEVLEAVARGVDVVEGRYPFEMAGAGIATDLARGASVNCRDRKWIRWKGGLVDGCACGVCSGGFSRGYVRHLFEVHEMMGVTLVAAHNLFDYLTWFARLREAVAQGRFEKFKAEFEERRALLRLDGAGP